MICLPSFGIHGETQMKKIKSILKYFTVFCAGGALLYVCKTNQANQNKYKTCDCGTYFGADMNGMAYILTSTTERKDLGEPLESDTAYYFIVNIDEGITVLAKPEALGMSFQPKKVVDTNLSNNEITVEDVTEEMN